MTDYKRFPNPRQQLAEILSGKATGEKRVRVAKPKRQGPSGHLASPLVLTFPLPPKELNPNRASTSHWTATAKKKRQYQEAVLQWCVDQDVPKLLLDHATVKASFYFRTAARRDKDNADASLKKFWDTLTQYGLFRDDEGLRHEPTEIVKDKENPRLEVVISTP